MDKANEPGVAWSDKLQCYYRGWMVTKEGWLSLILPEGSCTDMSGAIAVATAIMPNVERIQTWSGGIRDTAYVRKGNNWAAANFRMSFNQMIDEARKTKPLSEL